MFKRLCAASQLPKDKSGHFYCQRRFARKRPGQKGSEEPLVGEAPLQTASNLSQEPFTPGVAGLRSAGMMAAPPTTSLDRIRAQVRAMQEEIQEKAEQVELSDQQRDESEAVRHCRLTAVLKKSFARRNKPNSNASYDGKDVHERMLMRSQIAQRTLLNEVDEVVRKPKESDTLRFLQIAFPPSVLDSGKVMSVAEQLRMECQTALLALRKGLPDGAVPEHDLKERAWLDVLERKSPEELRYMWQSGLLGLTDVEHLLSSTPSTSGETDNTAHISATSTDNENSLPLEDCVEQLHDIHYLQELANELKATVLAGSDASASVDLAPVLQKVHEKRYDDITDSDLKMLEAYEESPVRLSGGDTGGDARRENSGASIEMTQSMVDRALNPSNRLLFYMAQKDDKVRQSLDALERIKRQALFDPVFQEAVRAAHEMEETSVDGHVRGMPDEHEQEKTQSQRLRAVLGQDEDLQHDESDESDDVHRNGERSAARKALSPRKQRALRRRAVALTRPHHAADVPYFFGDPRSVVPPRGNFNLPQPALSPEEKAERRGRRRRSRGRTRFSK